MMVQVGSTGCLCMCSRMCTRLLLSERHNCLCREGKCQTMLKQKQDSSSEVNLQHTHKLFVCVSLKGHCMRLKGVDMSLSLSCVHHQINYVLEVRRHVCVFVVCFHGYHVHHRYMFSMSDAMNNSFSS